MKENNKRHHNPFKTLHQTSAEKLVFSLVLTFIAIKTPQVVLHLHTIIQQKAIFCIIHFELSPFNRQKKLKLHTI